jgi:hypothetical protein
MYITYDIWDGFHAWVIISRLLKEKGRELFWPIKGNLRRTRINLKNG